MATTAADRNKAKLAQARAGAASRINPTQNNPTRSVSAPEIKMDLTKTPSTPFERRGMAPTVTPPAQDKFNPDIGQLSPDERIGNKAMEPIQRVDDKTADLFGGSNFRPRTPKTFDEWEKEKANDLSQAQQQDFDLAQRKSDLAGDVDQLGIGDLKRSQKSGMENMTTVYGTDREGGQSTGNQMLPDAYKRQTQYRITLAEQQADLAKEERMKILGDLRKAQENDQKELAKTLLGQLDLAEQQIAQYDERIAGIEQTRANTQKIQQETTLSNLAAMGSAVANLSLPELQRMGEGAGFTMPQMLTFQKASELRAKASETKDAAEAERMVLMADQLENEINWQVEDRPLEVRLKEADARYKEAQATKAYKEANGLPITSTDMLEDYTARQELAALSGQAGTAYLPLSSDPRIQTTLENGQLKIVTPPNYQAWCGEFVNDVFGSPIFGDGYSDKKGEVLRNGVLTKDVSNPQSDIVPGMAFVMPIYDKEGKLSPYGHTGIVLGVTADGKNIITQETNANGAYTGKPTGTGSNVTQEVRPISQIFGFVNPPNAKVVNAANGEDSYSPAQKAVMNSINPSDIKDVNIKVLKENGLTTADLFSYTSSTKKSLPDDKKSQIQDILTGIQELKTAPGFSGAVGFGLQKVGGTSGADERGWAGTRTASFISKFNTFRDTLALPALDSLKGAMSDKDIQFLRNTATALNLGMREKDFKTELDKLEKKYSELLTQGTDISDGMTSSQDVNDPLGLMSKPSKDPLGLFND
jgi:hypothetical protein